VCCSASLHQEWPKWDLLPLKNEHWQRNLRRMELRLWQCWPFVVIVIKLISRHQHSDKIT
jgi:hypothetical protein